MTRTEQLRALAVNDPDHPHSPEFRHDLVIALLRIESPAAKDRRLRGWRRGP